MDLDLTGRTALVTGAHRGTGQIIAARLAAEGATVLVHGFTPEQAEDACRQNGSGLPVAGDLMTDAGADALIAQCRARVERIDILVNNYGTTSPGRWNDVDESAWLDMYQRNVLSAQRLIKRLLPEMRRAGWGRIINLGTVGSTRPNARMPHYYASKGALATLTVGLAKEVAGTGIRRLGRHVARGRATRGGRHSDPPHRAPRGGRRSRRVSREPACRCDSRPEHPHRRRRARRPDVKRSP